MNEPCYTPPCPPLPDPREALARADVLNRMRQFRATEPVRYARESLRSPTGAVFTASAQATGPAAADEIMGAFGRLLEQTARAAEEFRAGFVERMQDGRPIRTQAYVGEPVREIKAGEAIDGD